MSDQWRTEADPVRGRFIALPHAQQWDLHETINGQTDKKNFDVSTSKTNYRCGKKKNKYARQNH